MEQSLKKIFKQSSYQPAEHLSYDIWKIIERKNSRMTKVKTFSYLSLGILSLSGSVFSIKFLVEQFARLGFFDYLSLAFSDGSVISIYWKEYMITLIDSLPVANLGISLALLLILFISMKKGMSYQFKGKMLPV